LKRAFRNDPIRSRAAKKDKRRDGCFFAQQTKNLFIRFYDSHSFAHFSLPHAFKMSAKKNEGNNRTFIASSDAPSVASVSLDGLVAFNGVQMRKIEKNVVVCCTNRTEEDDESNHPQTVAIISGGGSGHEPAMAGFVGDGFLHASVCGDVFASPSVEQISAAIENVLENNELVDSVLLAVMNYTGDVVNFSIARDRARKEYPKSRLKNIEVFAFDDDCSIPADERGKGGARGLCGTLLCLKAVSAAAKRGREFREVREIAERFRRNTKTFGFSLGRCDVPGQRKQEDLEVPDGKVELGLGIHNEPGFETVPFESAEKTVEIALDAIEKALELGDEKSKRLSAASGGIVGKIDDLLGLDGETKMNIGLVKPIELCLVVNGLGGTSNLELGLLADFAKKSLERRGGKVCQITHAMCGSFMTSLNMRGASLTVSVLEENDGELLDAPCEVNAWPRLINLSSTTTTTTTTIVRTSSQQQPLSTPDVLPAPQKDATEKTSETSTKEEKPEKQNLNKKEKNKLRTPKVTVTEKEAEALAACIQLSCATILSMRDELTRLDAIAGDGDCGDTLAAGASAILEDSVDYAYRHPDVVCDQLASSCARSMGGTSGVLYDVFFRAAGDTLDESGSDFDETEYEEDYMDDSFEYREALARGIYAIRKHGKATAGDRTMLDALMPALGRWGILMNDDLKEQCDRIAKAAKDGAEETRNMTANAGRASYVNKDKLKEQNVPDPGALAVAAWIGASCEEVTRLLANKNVKPNERHLSFLNRIDPNFKGDRDDHDAIPVEDRLGEFDDTRYSDDDLPEDQKIPFVL
jgi:dihydroxyacetone kinase